MRPEPVVFLLLAFSPPVVCGTVLVIVLGQDECVVEGGSGIGGLEEEGGVRRTLPDAGARVAAVCASVLLDVERATAFNSY